MEMVFFIPPHQRRLAVLAAQADSAPVLICGASGTGKGAIAQWIHSSGPRAGRPFIETTRDPSLPEQIPLAQGGTLVIREAGELTLSEQLLLLDFLKTRSIPVPESNGMRMLVNARVIVTTNQALESRAVAGLFNAELLARLNVFRIEMPPLSERDEEFEDITLGLLDEITRDLHHEYLRTISPNAWDALKAYDWPGNIRELRNVLKVAVITAKGDQIEMHDLPKFGHDRIDFRSTREQFEKVYIRELLKTFNWDIDATCKMARINKTVLMQKIEAYSIKEQNPSEPP